MASSLSFSPPEPPKSGILKQNPADSEIMGLPEELMPNRSPNKKVATLELPLRFKPPAVVTSFLKNRRRSSKAVSIVEILNFLE